jgi:redox-sensing transcriptional repressor
MTDVRSNGTTEQDEMKLIPEPTLRRLPLYYDYLKKYLAADNEYISCTTIAEALNFIPIQVRKDLEFTGVVGKPKVGYAVKELMRCIESFLKWDNTTDAFLVGAGHLGGALLGYKGFREHGLNIVAAFDVSQEIIGTQIHGKKVLPLEKLGELVRRMKVKIGIITVPTEAAQMVADEMVKAGIKAIWTFAPARLKVSDDIYVQHENLASSLAVLSQRISKTEIKVNQE